MKFRRTTLITVTCFCALAGLGLSRKIYLPIGLWLLVFSPSLILLKKKSLISLLIAAVLGLGLGIWRGQAYMQKLSELNNLAGQKVTLEVTANNDAVYGTKSQIEFNAGQIMMMSPYRSNLSGNIKVSGFGEPMVYRGDRVEVIGKIFPMRGSNQVRMAYAGLRITAQDGSWFNQMTRRFSTGMENALPEPLASFGLGLLVGQRTNLPADVLNQLTVVGLIHIVAVSGYNLTILIRAIQRLKIRSKYQRVSLSFILIIGFLMVTGFSASIVRAALVSVLGLLAWYYGRTLRPILIIAFAAALTGLFNPFYVWSDIGWYLSFLAFFGILVIAPIINSYLPKFENQNLTLVLVETLSAEIMTLPLIMMVFGQMSIVAIVANLLVVPLVPVAMLLCAIAALAGAWLLAFAGWFAWPARIILTYILDLVHMLASIPHIVLHLTLNPTLMLSMYLLITTFAAVFYRRSKLKPNEKGGR
jgi:competence protein ComEC